MDQTIQVPDGYNGHTVECEAEPIAFTDNLVKLRVAGSYQIKWCTRKEWEQAKRDAELLAAAAEGLEIYNPQYCFTDGPALVQAKDLDVDVLQDWEAAYRLMIFYGRAPDGLWLSGPEVTTAEAQIEKILAELKRRNIRLQIGATEPSAVIYTPDGMKSIKDASMDDLRDWLEKYRRMRHVGRRPSGVLLTSDEKTFIYGQIRALEAEIRRRGVNPTTGAMAPWSG